MSALIWAGLGAATANPASPTRVALERFWDDLAAATIYKTWKRHNPGELARLEGYAAGGARPDMLTAFGRALIDIVDVHRAVGAPIRIP